MTEFIKATDVISPKAHWHLIDVILDRGETNCAYALGTWDGDRRIGFRWNGSNEGGPIGNPQSRGLPTWTMLDPALHEAVVALLSPEKQALARRFLGLTASAASRKEMLTGVREFHRAQVAKIISNSPSVLTLGGGLLIMHVVPLSLLNPSTRQINQIYKSPERFSPIGGRALHSRIDVEGLLVGSNAEGLARPQRAYVRIFDSAKIEAVASSLGRGEDGNGILLPVIQATVIKYAQNYAAALHSCEIEPPMAILASLAGVKGMRLLQDFQENAFMEDMPFQTLNDNAIELPEIVFEVVPQGYNESAKALMPMLNRLANAAGLPSPPYFDVDGNYVSKLL